MTLALTGYSGVFMRYAMAVTPRNYLLFGCHVVNFSAQLTQGYRYINYHHMGGKQQALEKKAKEGLGALEKTGAQAEGLVNQSVSGAKDVAVKVESKASELAGQAKAKVESVTR